MLGTRSTVAQGAQPACLISVVGFQRDGANVVTASRYSEPPSPSAGLLGSDFQFCAANRKVEVLRRAVQRCAGCSLGVRPLWQPAVDGLQPMRGVIFDLDGLLSDTEPLWLESARVLLGRRGLKPDPTLRPRLMGRHPTEVAAIYVEHYALKDRVEDLVCERMQIMRALHRDWPLAPMPGAEQLVTALGAQQIPLAVASGSPDWLVALVVERLGMRDAFTVLVGSDRIARGKPAPDTFLLAAELLGVAPGACVVLEDSAAGIQAALAAGMACVAVPGPETARQTIAGAQLVVESLSAVTPGVLLGLVPTVPL